MATIKHYFKECKTFKEVKHYELVNSTGTNLLSYKINISKDRSYSNAKGILYWLRLRKEGKWSKVVTGLKITPDPLVYYGDIPTYKNGVYKPTHLLVFKFVAGGSSVAIDYYPDYYPTTHLELRKHL